MSSYSESCRSSTINSCYSVVVKRICRSPVTLFSRRNSYELFHCADVKYRGTRAWLYTSTSGWPSGYIRGRAYCVCMTSSGLAHICVWWNCVVTETRGSVYLADKCMLWNYPGQVAWLLRDVEPLLGDVRLLTAKRIYRASVAIDARNNEVFKTIAWMPNAMGVCACDVDLLICCYCFRIRLKLLIETLCLSHVPLSSKTPTGGGSCYRRRDFPLRLRFRLNGCWATAVYYQHTICMFVFIPKDIRVYVVLTCEHVSACVK